MRELLKNIGFRLTELADYLQVSRPTLYKYIECYESGEYSEIRSDILLFFSFLESNPCIDKRVAMQFIIEHVGKNGESVDMTGLIESLERFGLDRGKTDFVLSVVSGGWIDDMIPVLNRYRTLVGMPMSNEKRDKYRDVLEQFKDSLSKVNDIDERC